jgi:hypothetical protein
MEYLFRTPPLQSLPLVQRWRSYTGIPSNQKLKVFITCQPVPEFHKQKIEEPKIIDNVILKYQFYLKRRTSLFFYQVSSEELNGGYFE